MTPEHFRSHLERLIRTAPNASRAGDLALVWKTLDDPEWEPDAFVLAVSLRVFRLRLIIGAINRHHPDKLTDLMRIAPMRLNARECDDAAELLALLRENDDDPGDARPAPRRLQ